MGKHSRTDNAGNSRKRQKIVYEPPTSEDVHTSRQLRQLLAFDQDLKRARHGLVSFKNFLDNLICNDGDNSQEKQILIEYLDAVKPRRPDDEEAPFLADIMETWSLAGQLNNDNVLSAVAVALALLLKVISSLIDLVPHGLGICRTLLQTRQQWLLAQNLSADKGKEFIISPTLRLIREVVCFDGGVYADGVFRARTNTFKNLGRNMGIKFLGEGLESPQRPSARTGAVRLFLSTLKFVDAEAKQELLSQKDIVFGVTKTIKEDPPHLVHEILESLMSFVVKDENVSRYAKLKALGGVTLTRIASLYTYRQDASNSEVLKKSVPDAAHEFLMAVCCSPSGGILKPDAGFYPQGTNPDEIEKANTWGRKFNEELPITNNILLDLILTLRPWSSLKQSELVVAIFRAAPELVAAYFRSASSLACDPPKLTSTWIGYATFLFKTIQLPIPAHFGHAEGYAKLPPPTSVVLENILPLPLNEKVLTRCLNQQSKLISFFAIRLLVVAAQKLEQTITLYHEVNIGKKGVWAEAANDLKGEFGNRVPAIKDVVLAYKSTPQNDLLQREAASRLLFLYTGLITQSIQAMSFDVSPLLLSSVGRLQHEQETPQDYALILMELENLVAVADLSVGPRWFSKAKELGESLFINLLKVCVRSSTKVIPERLVNSLHAMASQYGLVDKTSSHSGFSSLFWTLRLLGDSVTDDIWSFLDNCATRCAQFNSKYLISALELSSEQSRNPSKKHPSPLTITMVEQLPFAVSSSKDGELEIYARFLSTYMSFCRIGEDEAQINQVLKSMRATFPKSKAKMITLTEDLPKPQGYQLNDSRTGAVQSPTLAVFPVDFGSPSAPDLSTLLSLAARPEHDNAALTRWINKPVEALIDEGHAAALINLLTSPEPSIRREAHTNLAKMAERIKSTPSYRSHLQIWLLLMELVETASSSISQGPTLTLFTSFAAHALPILIKPLHPLYPKINTFLTSSPCWRSGSLPLVHAVLAEEPDDASQGMAFFTCVLWLLDYLSDGLRTEADVGVIARNRPLMERLLSATLAHAKARERVRFAFYALWARMVEAPGGADVLVTRMGVDATLTALEEGASRTGGTYGEREANVCALLREKLRERMKGSRGPRWSRRFYDDEGETERIEG